VSQAAVLSAEERRIRQKLKDDFEHYAAKALTIRAKDGALSKLALNSAQRYLHAKAQEQLARTGRVRLIIVKGRQQGISTYIEGRLYWRVTHRRGLRAFILTHQQSATDALFDIVDRYHENCPAIIRPQTGAANAKELNFRSLDSGYEVATAGSAEVGRGRTMQLFHGSEVAFWANADKHAAGALQTVPDADGTEVFLESTGNGIGNWFHGQWTKATRGESEFEPVFIPWFWQDEYRAPAPKDFTPDEAEAQLIALYGLDAEQLTWRRRKIAQLLSEEKFAQEYPCTPEEAFATNPANAVIPSALVRAAVARDVKAFGRPIWGVDVARSGEDRCALAKRQGPRLLEPVTAWREADTMRTAGLIKRAYDETEPAMRPAAICIDVIGIGAGVVDRLSEQGLPVVGVNVGESAAVKERFNRQRDELWWAAREWFEGRACSMPEDESLIGELTAVIYGFTSANKLKVEDKQAMKKRLGLSPDLADAFVLTFAADAPTETEERRSSYAGPQSWMG
jgi:hypothetical protein